MQQDNEQKVETGDPFSQWANGDTAVQDTEPPKKKNKKSVQVAAPKSNEVNPFQQWANPQKKSGGEDLSKTFPSTSQLPLQNGNVPQGALFSSPNDIFSFRKFADNTPPEKTVRVVADRIEDQPRKKKFVPSIDNNFGLPTPQELSGNQEILSDSKANTNKESIDYYYNQQVKGQSLLKPDEKPISLLDAQERDKAQGKAIGSNIWNSFLTGIGQLSSGVSDVMFQGLRKILPDEGISDEEALKKFREEGEPILRTATKQLLGARVTTAQEKNFNDNFWTSAVGGLASSVPAMIGTRGSSLILQAYDNGLEEINNTEKGKDLPENTKTVFGLGVGIANGVLEKVGLDKIFGKQSNRVAANLAVKTFSDLIKKSEVPITSALFEQALSTAGRDLKKKIIDAGGRIGTAGLVEFTTGASQEASNVLAEEIINKTQNKQVFEPTSWGEKMSRILYSGAQEAVGGGLLGAASIPFHQTRNYIAEKVSEAKTTEDVDALKTELMGIASTQQLSQADAEEINKTIDDYVRVVQKIPTDIPNKKEVADKILDKENIHSEIDAKEKEIINVDDAFKHNLRTEIAALRNREQEINKEINPQSQQPETDTKLSVPIEGLDEQGVPIEENILQPTKEVEKIETSTAPILKDLMKQDLTYEQKYKEVEFNDPVLAATKKMSAKSARSLMEKRHTILDNIVNCLT